MRLAPHSASRYQLAFALVRSDVFEEGLILLRRVAAENPGDWMPLALIAEAEERGARLDEAEHAYGRALALAADNVDLLRVMVGFHHRTSRADTALARCRRRLAQLDAPIDVLLKLVEMMVSVGRTAEPAATLLAMARRWPEHTDIATWLVHAQGLWARSRDAELSSLAMKSLAALAPAHGPAYGMLGEAQLDIDPGRALALARRFVTMAPMAPEAHGVEAMALRVSQQFVYARRALRRALTIDPQYLAPLVNLTQLLLLDRRPAQAERTARRAIAVRPPTPRVLWSLGNTLMVQGKVDPGLRYEENRLFDQGDPPSMRSRILRPRWEGEPLDGRTLLIWPERGLADQFYYTRWLPLVPRGTGRILFECDERLVTLYQRSFPEIEVFGSRPTAEETVGGARVDLQIPVGSLPLVYTRESVEAVAAMKDGRPWPVRPYLRADTSRIADWNGALEQQSSRLRIAVAWRSGLLSPNRNFYYLTAEDMVAMLRDLPVTVVSLQYDLVDGERERLESGLPDTYFAPIDLKNDLDDVAALIQACDLVISVGTSSFTMAGALGVPVWCCYFGRNWMTPDFDCNPFIPNIAHFTRGLSDTWGELVQRVRAALIRCLDAEVPETAPHLPRPRR